MQKKTEIGYMLDTNALNGATDYQLRPEAFIGRRVFVSHIQRNELSETRVGERKRALLDSLTAIGPEKIPTASAVFDVSEWNEAKWSSNDRIFEKLLQRITDLDGAARKPSRKANRLRDALIAETALKCNLTLVTNDCNMTKAAREVGSSVITFEDFLQQRD